MGSSHFHYEITEIQTFRNREETRGVACLTRQRQNYMTWFKSCNPPATKREFKLPGLPGVLSLTTYYILTKKQQVPAIPRRVQIIHQLPPHPCPLQSQQVGSLGRCLVAPPHEHKPAKPWRPPVFSLASPAGKVLTNKTWKSKHDIWSQSCLFFCMYKWNTHWKHFSTIQTICPTVPAILVMVPIHFSFLQAPAHPYAEKWEVFMRITISFAVCNFAAAFIP